MGRKTKVTRKRKPPPTKTAPLKRDTKKEKNKHSDEPIASASSHNSNSDLQILVQNLACTTTEERLKNFFSKFGNVKEVRRSPKSRNNAFIAFETEEEVRQVYQAKAEDLVLGKRQLYVDQPTGKKNKLGNGEAVAEMVCETATNEVTIHNLPVEVMEFIFSFLDIKQRVGIERVCKRWRSIGKERPWTYPTSLVLDHTHHDNALKSLQCTHGVVNAILSRCGKGLKVLTVRSRDSSKKTAAIIGKHCSNLTKLKLYDLTLTSHNCKAIAQGCPSLKSIALDCLLECTENQLAECLQHFQMLECFELAIARKMDGTFCKGLNPKLKTLRLSVFLTALPDYSSIIQIVKSRCPDLQEFALNCDRRNELSLHISVPQPKPEELMKLFCHYKVSLRSVFLGGYEQAFDWRKALKVFDNLEELALVDCHGVDDELLKFVAKKCVKLRSLNIARNLAITDKGVGSLSVLPNLKVLDISRTQLCGEGLEVLAKEGHLEEVYMRACKNFKEIHCRNLAKYCPNMKLLDVSSTRKITKRVVKAFWKAVGEKYLKGSIKIIVGDTSVSHHRLRTCPQINVHFYSTEELNPNPNRNSDEDPDEDDDGNGSYAWTDEDLDSDINPDCYDSFYDTSDDSIVCPLPLFPMRKKRRYYDDSSDDDSDDDDLDDDSSDDDMW